MNKLVAYFLLFFSAVFNVNAQIVSPSSFLGYDLGTRFTLQESVVNYFNEVAKQSKNVKLIHYGKTYGGRDLIVAIVSTEENINNLEGIRQNNLSLTGLQANRDVKLNKQPAIVWLSYGVHGNEPSSTETAMKMLYDLTLAKTDDLKQWLKNTVVLIDPCLNPDGRDRFVYDFNSKVGKQPNPDPGTREHAEAWPSGRGNHYYFDLNRDWAWQTQVESQQRVVLYNKWMPQVHVDFHEQDYNEPYYFAPAAEPMHQSITAWQRQFQVVVGKNNAHYFDERGWKYFTKEKFDLLYPSYGDTYPLFNGAIGMTYEQGGIRAGLSVITKDGDTLTLKDRIEHHYISGLSTLQVVSQNKDKLLNEYRKYFLPKVISPLEYKSFVVKAENISRLKALAELLTKNQIQYAFGSNQSAKGYNYETKQQELFKIERNDLIVNLQQPKAVLANVLFEPQTVIADSNTYDITAWALPYAYGLKAFACKESIKGHFSFIDEQKPEDIKTTKPFAWAFNWGSTESVQMLKALYQAKIKVRIADEPFTVGGNVYKRSTLLVYRLENEKHISNLYNRISNLAEHNNVKLYPILNGYVEKGRDFGSSVYRALSEPKIAILSGAEVSAQSLGEVWHFFEQEMGYPIYLINLNELNNVSLDKYNVLIFPDGEYNHIVNNNLLSWINKGGKLIAISDAIESLINQKEFEIKKKPISKVDPSVGVKYQGKSDWDNLISGAIYKLTLETTHPLSYGLGKYYYSLKTDDNIYQPLKRGHNIGLIQENSLMSGIVGTSVQGKLNNGLLIGTQNYNEGKVIYFSENPLFRQFWEIGKTIFINSIFLY